MSGGADNASQEQPHILPVRRMSGGADNASQEQPRILPVNNIQLVRMGNSESTTAAFAMLHRIPGVLQAITNAAMAVKRGQEEAGIDQVIPPTPVVMEQASPDITQAAHNNMENLRRASVISQEVDRAIQRVTRKAGATVQDDTVTGSGGERVEGPGGGRNVGSGGSVSNVVVPPKKLVVVDAVSYAVMFGGGEKFVVFNGEKVHVVPFPLQGIGDDEFVVIAGRRSMVGNGGLRGRRRHRRPGRIGRRRC
jgi:hypothetical protein